MSGNKLTHYYNRTTNGFNALGTDLNEMLFSTCYSNTIQRIDQDIQRKILTPFASSGMACQNFDSIQVQIDILLQMRWELRPTVANLPKSISKKYCTDDRRSESLQQTNATWKELQKKIKEIGKRIEDTSKTQTQDEKKKAEQQAEKESKIRKLRIQQKARQRVQSFVNEFIQNSIVAPLYAERSQINQNLKSLPNGTSRFVTTKPLSISEMFYPPKDAHGKTIFSTLFQESAAKKASTLQQEKNTVEQNISTMSAAINYKNNYNDKLKILLKKLQDDLSAQESLREFSGAYSKSIINSLVPFHNTLQKTEQSMKEKTTLLQKTLNRQNVGVR